MLDTIGWKTKYLPWYELNLVVSAATEAAGGVFPVQPAEAISTTKPPAPGVYPALYGAAR